ncbi:N2227-like protein [Penicillium digitatum]|nr:N2227-like protein [Penicillium digitatum]
MLREAFFICICVAWAGFAIHLSPWIKEISHKVEAYTTTASQYPVPFTTHNEEHTRLLQSLERSSGKWDSTHPRHRLLTALYGYDSYKDKNIAEVDRWRNLYKNVPKRQRTLLESTIHYTRKLNTMEHLLDTNNELARSIVDYGLSFYNISQSELDEFIKESEAQQRSADKTSVSQGMKHFVRDWADEGNEERQQSFGCILKSLAQMPRTKDRPLRVLLPGSGLGRLAHEADKLGGFEVTMNEWSTYMNLAYRYVSSVSVPDSVHFHPYIDWWSHQAKTDDLQRSVTFPNQVIEPSSVLLVEGDFTTVFAEHTGQYDIIVTLFFIDTARNLVTYLETIHRLLRPGGRWVNLGPLLYGTAPFVQLSLDEIVTLSESMGFEFQETDATIGNVTLPNVPVRGLEVAYGRNGRGLNKNAYQAQYWEAVKR